MPNYKHDGFFNACDDRCTIIRNESVPRRLAENEDIEEFKWDAKTADNSYVYLDKDGVDGKIKLNDIYYPAKVNADWNATRGSDSEGYYFNPAFIKNKPHLSKVAITGRYKDLIGVPGGPDSEGGETREFAEVAFTGDYYDLKNRPDSEGEMFSGDYYDLRNRPYLEVDEEGIITSVTVGALPAGAEFDEGTTALEILESILISPDKIEVAWGVSNDVPIVIDESFRHKKTTKSELVQNGFFAKYEIGDSEGKGGYNFVAVRSYSGVKCKALRQGFNNEENTWNAYITAEEGLTEDTIGGWHVYRLDTPSLGTFYCKWIFVETTEYDSEGHPIEPTTISGVNEKLNEEITRAKAAEEAIDIKVDEHIADHARHVETDDRIRWDAKQEALTPGDAINTAEFAANKLSIKYNKDSLELKENQLSVIDQVFWKEI